MPPKKVKQESFRALGQADAEEPTEVRRAQETMVETIRRTTTAAATDKRTVNRGKFVFEKKVSAILSQEEEEQLQQRLHRDGRPNMQQGFFSKLLCPLFRTRNEYVYSQSPDAAFCASSLIQLSHGITAYRLIEPSTSSDDKAASLPLIVCLHGLYDSSYIWGDCADLLCDCERGPNCRVLVFDFYGHGRSPWTGIPCTLDVLVVQTKELLDLLGLADSPVSLLGHDLGGAVAIGFAAKYPDLCQSICLVAPVGIRYRTMAKEDALKVKYFGEYLFYKRRNHMSEEVEARYLDHSPECLHRIMIDKQRDMVEWQLNNTNGYLGAILSSIRSFPLRGMDELFTAVGRFERPILVLWGDSDHITSYARSINIIERCFPKGYVVTVAECGHDPLIEKFTDVMTEILSFFKLAHDEIDEKAAAQAKADAEAQQRHEGGDMDMRNFNMSSASLESTRIHSDSSAY